MSRCLAGYTEQVQYVFRGAVAVRPGRWNTMLQLLLPLLLEQLDAAFAFTCSRLTNSTTSSTTCRHTWPNSIPSPTPDIAILFIFICQNASARQSGGSSKWFSKIFSLAGHGNGRSTGTMSRIREFSPRMGTGLAAESTGAELPKTNGPSGSAVQQGYIRPICTSLGHKPCYSSPVPRREQK